MMNSKVGDEIVIDTILNEVACVDGLPAAMNPAKWERS